MLSFLSPTCRLAAALLVLRRAVGRKGEGNGVNSARCRSTGVVCFRRCRRLCRRSRCCAAGRAREPVQRARGGTVRRKLREGHVLPVLAVLDEDAALPELEAKPVG